MKPLRKLLTRLLIVTAWFFVVSVRVAFSQSVPPLGDAQSFAILGATTITSTGPSVISGNVGVSPGSTATGFPPALIDNGALYLGAASLALQAQNSALIAYDNLKDQTFLPANDLSGMVLGQTPGAVVLTPGVYHFATSAQLNAILTLDDGGDPNAIFIFQIGTTLTTASNAEVRMASGGRGNNVYWQIGTSATIGTSTTFTGNILAKPA